MKKVLPILNLASKALEIVATWKRKLYILNQTESNFYLADKSKIKS